MTQRKILITGCAGFIGFHLANRLFERGDSIIGFDNFNDYYTPQLKYDRRNLLEKKGIRVDKEELAKDGVINRYIETEQVTHIVHLAAQAGVRYSIKHPEVYIKSNVDGFLKLLEACKDRPDIPIIYASSSSVYGKNEKVPFAVGDTTDKPANIYGMTKKANELMAYVYNQLYGLTLIGLRFFTVYGPWGRPDMAYSLFTKALYEGKAIDLYNFGTMRRDFTYIDDIIDGIEAAFTITSGNHLFNLGNNKPESLLHFVELIEKATGRKAQKNLLPMPPGEIVETYADIEQSVKLLGFLPKTSLEAGIPRFVDWYRQYHSI